MGRPNRIVSLAPQGKFTSRPDRRDPGVNLRRVAGHRVGINQSEHTAMSVPCPLPVLASEPNRSTRTRRFAEDAQCPAADKKPLGRAPGPHGVRARRPDADLEDIEGADRLQTLIPSNNSRKANLSWMPLAIDIRTNHTIRCSAPRPNSPARLHCSIVASCNNFFKGLKVFYYTTRP